METETEATVEDLYRVPENGKAELVDGRIVRMSPTGGWPSRAAMRILFGLYEYEQQTGSGVAFQDNTGFLVDLPRRKSFSPDASFYTGMVSPGFQRGAPVFAVEVRSENDYGEASEQEMAVKRADYFRAGTRVVWDVDVLREQVVRVYRASSPDAPTVYGRGEVAEAEPALPGWSMSVDEILVT